MEKILEEISVDDSVQYVFIKERHLARIEEDTTLFYGTDHVNSTALMTDENGEIVWSGDVSPFGDYSVIDSDSYEEIGLKYTGKDLDEDTGLMYYNARYYDPELGRFLQADTMLDGLNQYTYCGNNPVMYSDPTGNFIIEAGIIIGAIVGAYVGDSIANNDFNVSNWD